MLTTDKHFKVADSPTHSFGLNSLLRKCLETDPDKRDSAEQILKLANQLHAIFKVNSNTELAEIYLAEILKTSTVEQVKDKIDQTDWNTFFGNQSLLDFYCRMIHYLWDQTPII